MSQARRPKGRPKIRLTVKLDLEWDADVIAWLSGWPEGERSHAVRNALRSSLRSDQAADLDAIRDIVAGELARAMSGQRLVSATADPPAEESQANMEAKFGGKLDRLLGSISQGGHGKPDED